MITIKTKDFGDVKDLRNRNAEFKKTLVEYNEDYIKKEMGIDGY